MRNVIAIIFVFASLVTMAQAPYAQDSVNGDEVVTLGPVYATGKYQAIGIDVLFEEIGGTADGTAILQARNSSEAEWTTLTTADFSEFVAFSSNDTFDIADDTSTWKIQLIPGFRQYQVSVDGTASDSVYVSMFVNFAK